MTFVHIESGTHIHVRVPPFMWEKGVCIYGTPGVSNNFLKMRVINVRNFRYWTVMSNKKKGWCGLVTTWRLVISISIQLNVVLLLKYTPCSCQQVIFFTATRKTKKKKKKKREHVLNRGYKCQNCCNKKKKL